MSMTSLQLPEQIELEVAASDGDQAAVENVTSQEPAAADAEANATEADAEGQETEGEEWCETGDDSGGLDDLHDPEFVETDEAEDTLLEEPADEEQAAEAEEQPAEETAPGSQLAAIPNGLTPHQPPKPAALVAYEHRRAEARDRYEGTMFEWRKLEAAAKAAKERWKDAEDQLFAVLNEGGDFEEEEVEARPAASVAAVESRPVPAAAVEGVAGDSSAPTQAESPAAIESPATSAADSDAWRRVPISELHLENIKGLGAKKIEQITAACPTIGHLEDLRAGFDGLKALDGIGQAKADAIEEAILNWLSKNRDAEFLAAVRAGGGDAGEALSVAEEEEAPAEETVATTEVVEEAADDSATAAPTEAAELPSVQEKIAARAQAIFFRTGDLSSVSPEDCLSQQLDDARYFEGGWEAYNAGSDLIDCPIDPAGVERDDWLRGWMSAKLTNEEGWQGPGSEN